MIFGIGNDISKVSRFEKWVKNQKLIERYFNEKEIKSDGSLQYLCQRYAARFAAKEAFGKAMGTGVFGFSLRDVFVTNGKAGEPILNVTGDAKTVLDKLCPSAKVFVSLSHENDFAIATVLIEKI